MSNLWIYSIGYSLISDGFMLNVNETVTSIKPCYKIRYLSLKIWRYAESPYLCNVFFIVLDLRLTKDWLSGIDSLFLCFFPSKNIASLSGRDGYPIPRIYRHYHKWIPSLCLKWIFLSFLLFYYSHPIVSCQ